jgi:hypothetical protein
MKAAPMAADIRLNAAARNPTRTSSACVRLLGFQSNVARYEGMREGPMLTAYQASKERIGSFGIQR